METTEEAVPTITSPITQSSATSTSSTVEIATSRPPMRTPVVAARLGGVRAVTLMTGLIRRRRPDAADGP